jgi:bacterioferritin (cytochrome b1)
MTPTTTPVFNLSRTVHLLQEILEARLSNVVCYTYYACCVSGRLRMPLSRLFQAQANTSLIQAQAVSNILLALNERPGETPNCSVPERSHPTQMHAPEQFLASSLNHELRILALYQEVIDLTTGRSQHLYQFAQEQILSIQRTCQDLHQELHQLKQPQASPGHSPWQSAASLMASRPFAAVACAILPIACTP